MNDVKITKHQFYFETPLYETVNLTDCEDDLLSGSVAAYSTAIPGETTYSINTQRAIGVTGIASKLYLPYREGGFARITLTCKRTYDEKLTFFVFIDISTGTIVKAGQLPSLADLQFGELSKKYDRLMDRRDLKEFKKAIGLAAHGTGIGSFVYLRRIFENLIEDAYQQNKNSLGIEEIEYRKLRMTEKVSTLSAHLPSQLVKMKSVYSILSKGIHELDEKECLAYFDVTKLAIELILDQKIEEDRKKKRDADVLQKIAEIESKLGSKKS